MLRTEHQSNPHTMIMKKMLKAGYFKVYELFKADPIECNRIKGFRGNYRAVKKKRLYLQV